MMDELDASDLIRMQEQDNQVFENIITRIYSDVLRRGDACLDGGAHNGLHTLRLARLVGPEGTVLAVEPIPSVAQTLEDVLGSQCVHNVRVIRHALYHQRQTVRFNIVKNAPTRSGIIKTSYPFAPDFEEIPVSTILIDDIAQGLEALRFCKLDLEGAEFRALQGARNSIKRHSPFLIFERSLAATTWYRYTPDDFFSFFHELNYKTFDLFGSALNPEDWTAPGRPWYALGVRSGSKDEAFVYDRLPEILHSLLERERSPTTTSSQPPTGIDGPVIWAAPNPVPAGLGEGTTVVHWDTGDGSAAEVYVSVNGDEGRLFFRSAGGSGSRPAPWINAWGSYDFQLYRGAGRAELLQTVTVTRRKR